MKQFTDRLGHEWDVSITAGSIKRVRGRPWWALQCTHSYAT